MHINRLGINQLKYINPNWLIRSKVEIEVDSKVIDMARAAISREIKWYSDKEEDTLKLSEFISEFVDMSDWTFEEFHFVVYWVEYYCSIAYAYYSGDLENPEEVPKKLVE